MTISVKYHQRHKQQSRRNWTGADCFMTQEEEHSKLCSTHLRSPALEPFSGITDTPATWTWLQGCTCESGSDSQPSSKSTYWLLFQMFQVICKVVLFSTIMGEQKLTLQPSSSPEQPTHRDFNSKCFPHKTLQQGHTTHLRCINQIRYLP